MSSTRYAVTPPRNSETQHWCGQLRGYAVTRPLRMCAGVGGRVPACMQVWVCDACVTTQPRNSLGVVRVSRLRALVTA